MTDPDAQGRAHHPLALLGPTASGKSDLALAVAERLGGVELVSVDSMQVYRGMDVGTAKPTPAEQRRVVHHLIDLVDPGDEFTVGQFQRRAREAIEAIRGRGAIPVLVGGTGLYLRAVVDDLDLPGRYPELRAELDLEADAGALHRRLQDLDPVAAARMEPTNHRRVARALEVTLGSGRPFSTYGPGLETYPPTDFVQVALRWDRAVLDERIADRYRRQLADGFLDEVRAFVAAGPSRSAAQALGYKELAAHLRGECELDEAVENAIRRTRRFARRQERWFRRDPRIRWLDAPVDVGAVIDIWDEERTKHAG